MPPHPLDLGATPVAGGVRFRVWAPTASSVEVERVDQSAERTALQRAGEYFEGILPAAVEERYWYWLDGTLRRPDPASRCQPEGVHGPSLVVDPAFAWQEGGWSGIPLEACIFYELHVGTFTPEGTFDAAISRLDSLRELGITAVELMPVAQFPGERNWGYDGVFPFAPQLSYGGVAGLKRFIAACHRQGLAVFLDVVYNHLGPEGNYLHAFGPYFTDRYRTPWGDAINFDGPYSDGVRHYFVTNARSWIDEYHLDGLRLDAVHGIFDFSACHILAELAASVHGLARELGRPVYVIAESDLNDPRLVNDPDRGGYGLDALWNDDFHHALHTLLTGEQDGYYQDFGAFSQLVTALSDGFVYAGEYSRYRRRSHGRPSTAVPPARLVVCLQNHDQIGNRARGDRLAAHLSPPQLRLAMATVLLSPYLPLLFMGEEYGETAPFPFFTSYGDPDLVETVRQGRREEFSSFAWPGEIPDPQAESTFRAARLDPQRQQVEKHARLLAFTREVLRLRKALPPLSRLSREGLRVVGFPEQRLLCLQRTNDREEALCLFNFSDQPQELRVPFVHGRLRLRLDGDDRRWGGSGQPGRRDSLAAKETAHLPPWGVLLYAGGESP